MGGKGIDTRIKSCEFNLVKYFNRTLIFIFIISITVPKSHGLINTALLKVNMWHM